jgi:hypothetical protein
MRAMEIKPPKYATLTTRNRVRDGTGEYDADDYARYQRESMAVAVIQAIKDNEELRRELFEYLIDAIDWNKDDIRLRIRASLRIED